MTPPDLLSALDAATDHFGRHLSVVGHDAWTAATPCTDWDVHYLVAHVVGGNRFASLVLAGRTADEAMEAVMGSPQLGADPLGAFVETSAEQRDLFNRPGALDRLVDHPLGELTAERFLTVRVFDIALHSWDLAIAIGRDGALDPALAELVLDIVLNEAPGMGFGIEPCGDVGPDATAMERLLDLCGRCAPGSQRVAIEAAPHRRPVVASLVAAERHLGDTDLRKATSGSGRSARAPQVRLSAAR